MTDLKGKTIYRKTWLNTDELLLWFTDGTALRLRSAAEMTESVILADLLTPEDQEEGAE